MRNKTIELDIFNTSLTASQAIEKGKEFVEAVDTAGMINMLIFKQTDGKTKKQIGYILGDVRRFINALEAELLEQKRERMKREKQRPCLRRD